MIITLLGFRIYASSKIFSDLAYSPFWSEVALSFPLYYLNYQGDRTRFAGQDKLSIQKLKNFIKDLVWHNLCYSNYVLHIREHTASRSDTGKKNSPGGELVRTWLQHLLNPLNLWSRLGGHCNRLFIIYETYFSK